MASYPPVYKFPRQIESVQAADAVGTLLQARTRKLWERSRLEVSVLEFSDVLKNALLSARRTGHLLRGLDAAAQKLDRERHGLLKLKQAEDQGERISRLILMANDGSGHFYRKADRLLAKHAPRLLGCIIDTGSHNMGRLLFGPAKMAKLVLVDHKETVARILMALI